MNRRESQSQTRRNKNVEDILKAVSKIDETYPEESVKPVIFVAKDLCKLPCNSKKSANDDNTVENRLRLLELQMVELLTDKSRNSEDKTTGHVRHKVHHNLPRLTVHIDDPVNERRQMQRTVDNDGSSKTGDVVNNTQTSTKNPRLSYADMASNPNGM